MLSYNDLRPISILPVLSKHIEKIMYYQIQVHLNTYDILPQNQSYAQGLAWPTDQCETTVLTLLDFSKVLDTISHEIFYTLISWNVQLGSVGFSL